MKKRLLQIGDKYHNFSEVWEVYAFYWAEGYEDWVYSLRCKNRQKDNEMCKQQSYFEDTLYAPYYDLEMQGNIIQQEQLELF